MYPALAVLQALKSENLEVLWVGSQGGLEADLVKRAGYPFIAIPAAGLHGVGIKAMPGNLLRLLRGFISAKRILTNFQPDALFFTGGYVSIPIAFAGRKLPSLLFIPDIEPAMAVNMIARHASRITVSTADSLKFFDDKSKVVVTGYPLRSEMKTWEREKALQFLNLSHEMRVILFFGGSQGAQSINHALYAILPDLLKQFQVIHITGQHNLDEAKQTFNDLAAEIQKRYHPFAYLHSEEQAAAFTAADLVVSRAGAAILGEYPVFGLPAILVPYPHAWQYQQRNAKYLENHGAAIMLKDADLKTMLAETINNLFDHPDQLHAMQAAMRSLSNPQAAQYIARLLLDLVEKNNHAPKGGLL